MDLKERIKELCKKNNISMNQLEQELDFSKGYISKLGKSTPNATKIQQLANRLGVTVDYLMNGTVKRDDREYHYTNEETCKIAQEIFENPDLRSLFYAAKDLSSERLKAHIDFMQSLKRQEEKYNDEGC
ncbi:helix-turn-helix domain-containing protein [Lacrimispora indolis]|uniref:helix-turn-helix domain-containing protein n=1 Tax=Lacrimispora indolis TaxID=69825 RepID=UPI0004077AAD|nr:helix-turn-helix transcriptional regulator [[Clostridium] methoxybenzovorans]